ncbi:MAG: hypothetical protein HQL58_05260 [Magnetococcales bacterium]|nr:hypothetical protein [Magnetococcales bacterium]
MSSDRVVVCWYCGTALSSHGMGREDECPACRRATRVCRNCHFYDTSACDECREPQAERVIDKERANFCDFFEPDSQLIHPATPLSREAARQAADSLFRKS